MKSYRKLELMKQLTTIFFGIWLAVGFVHSPAYAKSCDDYCTPVGANLRYLYAKPVCMMVLECDPACGRLIYDLPATRKAYYCAFRKFNPPDDAVCMSKEECAVDNSVIASKDDVDLLTRQPRPAPYRRSSESNSSSDSVQ